MEDEAKLTEEMLDELADQLPDLLRMCKHGRPDRRLFNRFMQLSLKQKKTVMKTVMKKTLMKNKLEHLRGDETLLLMKMMKMMKIDEEKFDPEGDLPRTERKNMIMMGKKADVIFHYQSPVLVLDSGRNDYTLKEEEGDVMEEDVIV